MSAYHFAGPGSGDATRITVDVNHGGSFLGFTTTLITGVLDANRHYVIGASLRQGLQSLYVDGLEVDSDTNAMGNGNPTYAATSLTSFGDGAFLATRNSQSSYTFGYIFQGFGGPDLHYEIAKNPWCVFEQRKFPRVFVPAAGAAAVFTRIVGRTGPGMGLAGHGGGLAG